MSETLPVIEMPTGVSIHANLRLTTDFASIRTLIESGVSFPDAAKAFKVSQQLIRKRAKDEAWLTPAATEKLRKEIARKQEANFRRMGKAATVQEVKAEIWVERGERAREEAFRITEAALKGVTDEAAARFIKNPKGLLEIVQATRLVTGEEKADAQAMPGMAVNISFLRSQRPTDVVEAEVVEG